MSVELEPGCAMYEQTACPRCGGTDTRVTRTFPLKRGTRKRYHYCGRCHRNFKSLQAVAQAV